MEFAPQENVEHASKENPFAFASGVFSFFGVNGVGWSIVYIRKGEFAWYKPCVIGMKERRSMRMNMENSA